MRCWIAFLCQTVGGQRLLADICPRTKTVGGQIGLLADRCLGSLADSSGPFADNPGTIGGQARDYSRTHLGLLTDTLGSLTDRLRPLADRLRLLADMSANSLKVVRQWSILYYETVGGQTETIGGQLETIGGQLETIGGHLKFCIGFFYTMELLDYNWRAA